MRNTFKTLVRYCFAVGAFLGVAHATAEPLGGDFGHARVIVPAPEGPRYAHLAWAKIVRTGDGTLVVAYSMGRFHGNGGEGCPAVSVSHDGGKTFTAPHILREFSKETEYDNSANTALGVAEDGSVVLLAMAHTGEERNSIFGWRSADAGRTWEPTDTSRLADGKTGSVYGHVFSVPGKGLAVAGHFRPGSVGRTKGIWIAYSNDQGRSWGSPQVITEKKLFEPAIIASGQRLVGLFREPGRSAYYWQAVSDDGGEAWTLTKWPDRPAGDFYLPSPFITARPDASHGLYALESQRHVPGSLPGKVILWAADAQELEWTRLGVVVEFPETLGNRSDITYPWMTPLDGDEWFLVFYCGETHGPNSIYGMRLTLPSGE